MTRQVLVTGGSSIVGRFLLPRLARTGAHVHVIGRHPPSHAIPAEIQWHIGDVASGLPEIAIYASQMVHLAPLWLLPPLIAPLSESGLERLVAFSSTSRFTKLSSPDEAERRVALALAKGEESVAASCARVAVTWTLFRPTLIYGEGLDANVSRIARFILRFGFFPLPGAASGRRQPVHADDLAQACCAALDRPAAANRGYNLSGASTLTYREMVEAVFRGLGRQPRILSLPPALMRAALWLASRLPGLGEISPAMADRMLEDLSFDYGEATRDLDFRPRAFAYPG